MKKISTRIGFLAGFLVCAGLLVFALYLQHFEFQEPCPLCILQRIAFIGLMIIFLVAALHSPGKIGGYVYSGLLFLVAGLGALRPRGVVVQLGLGGDMTLPMMQVTAKELDLRGSFRFHEEFPLAVEMIAKGLIQVKPLITHTIAFDDAVKAFELAGDRSRVMKAQIAFN